MFHGVWDGDSFGRFANRLLFHGFVNLAPEIPLSASSKRSGVASPYEWRVN